MYPFEAIALLVRLDRSTFLITRLYLYGGYQILEGSLKDFYSICLDESETTFKWQEILPKGQTPGRRSKHGLIATKDKIYLIGGLLANNEASNDIYAFDPDNNLWELKKP
jgi:N-acetylneuraminic acid mutarotase